MAKGYLVIGVGADTLAQPVRGAQVELIGPEGSTFLTTDDSGKTPVVELDCPDRAYSLEPQHEVRPYAEYSAVVRNDGLQPVRLDGIEILADTHAVQQVTLQSEQSYNTQRYTIEIPDHTLWGDYPPKLAVDPSTQQLIPEALGTLPYPLVPEYVLVHDGLPSNTGAPNYLVTFKDYIKNVASSEIYSTWPVETIRANVLAILSFTMNRIYTEWYRNKGYNYTITSTTQFDQKFIFERNIFTEIGDVVDDIFNQYLTFPHITQPFFSQYSDGVRVQRAGWLSQWGSKELGDQGQTALEILKHYYGDSLYIESAQAVAGIPYSYPGYNLDLGVCGESVQRIQVELNYINSSFPKIPTVTPTGTYDEPTREAVRVFQEVFNLPVTGIVDFSTWYSISNIFVSVSDMLKGRYDF